LYQVHSKIAQSSGGKQASFYDGFLSIYREGGIKAFWKGNLTNVLKVVPESALFFTLFESFKKAICLDVHSPAIVEIGGAGASAGFVASLLMYPLETVKARWMTSPSGTYKSVVECTSKLVQELGWRGLYKGIGTQLLGAVPNAAIYLSVYELLKQRFIHKFGYNPGAIFCLLFGATASIFGQIFAYPSAVVRTRLQTQGTPGHPIVYQKGARSVVHHIWSHHGIRGFYQGILATYMKVIPAMGITFSVYETALNNMRQQTT